MDSTLTDAINEASESLTNQTEEENSQVEETSKEEATPNPESTEPEEPTEESSESDKPEEESENDKSEDKKEDKEDDKKEDNSEEEDDKKESFTHIDPSSLPEELKPIYKSLLGDYTRKRQIESQKVKDLQAEVERLKAIKEPDLPGGEVKIDLTNEQIANMSLEEYTDYVIKQTKLATMDSVKQSEVEEFEKRAAMDFINMDARLNPEAESMYDPRFAAAIGAKVDAEYAKYLETHNGSPIGFDYKSVANKAIKEWDDWVKDIRKRSVQEVAQKSIKKAHSLRKSTPPTVVGKATEQKIDSISDAIEAAFSE